MNRNRNAFFFDIRAKLLAAIIFIIFFSSPTFPDSGAVPIAESLEERLLRFFLSLAVLHKKLE